MEEEKSPVQHLLDGITSAVERIVEVVAPALATIGEAMCKAYHEAGMPYGDTSEGMFRWMKELSEISHMEQEIERIKGHHAMLVRLRRVGEKRRNEHNDPDV